MTITPRDMEQDRFNDVFRSNGNSNTPTATPTQEVSVYVKDIFAPLLLSLKRKY